MRFQPLMDPDQSDRREMFVTPNLHQWLYQSDSRMTRDFKANVRAFLRRFVIGGPIDNDAYMKNWKNDIFDIRVQLQPRKESTRIFGAFAKAECFIAIYQRPRKDFVKHPDLWDNAINRARAEFDRMFPGHCPVRARPFSNCVTFNYFDVNESRSF